jgi:hypothetical protein
VRVASNTDPNPQNRGFGNYGGQNEIEILNCRLTSSTYPSANHCYDPPR